MAWLKGLTRDELKGVKYALFGCGNTEWLHTYQAVPKLCNNLLLEHGAEQLLELFSSQEDL